MYPEPCRGCDGQGGRPLGTSRWQPAPALPPSRDWHLRCASQPTGHLRFPGQHLEAGVKLDSGNSPGGGEVHVPRCVPTVPLATGDHRLLPGAWLRTPKALAGPLDAVIRGSPGGRGGGRPCEGARAVGDAAPPPPPPPPSVSSLILPLVTLRATKNLSNRVHGTCTSRPPYLGSWLHTRQCPGKVRLAAPGPWPGLVDESALGAGSTCPGARAGVLWLSPLHVGLSPRPRGGPSRASSQAEPTLPVCTERHLARERPWVLRRKAKLQAERRKPHL